MERKKKRIWFSFDVFRRRYRLDSVSLRQPADGSWSVGDSFRLLSMGVVADVDAVEMCYKSVWGLGKRTGGIKTKRRRFFLFPAYIGSYVTHMRLTCVQFVNECPPALLQIFTTMEVTKSSGGNIEQSGC